MIVITTMLTRELDIYFFRQHPHESGNEVRRWPGLEAKVQPWPVGAPEEGGYISSSLWNRLGSI
jgi:hypothetical protein